MATITIKLDFLICETSINTFLCKFYYWDNSNSCITPWTAQQSTKQDALALMQTYSNDLYTALQNKEGITPLGGGSVTDYGTYSEMSFNIVIDTGSQSQDIDYTQILTSINSNLASIAANSGSIANKNNQSDIVRVIKDCFIERVGARDLSVFKTGSNDDSVKGNAFIPVLLFKIAQLLSSDSNFSYNSSILLSSRVLDNISKKISSVVPDNQSVSNSDFRRLFYTFMNVFLSSPVTDIPDSRSNSLVKAISEKLANTNDLHTISQAIDLISTAIAQTNNTLTNTNTDLGNIATNINSIQSNPLIEVNIDVPYEVKNLTKKDTEY